MNPKDGVKRTPADYEKIIPAYFETGNNPELLSGNNEKGFLLKEFYFDSFLTESGKNFPAVKGLENDELWFEMVTDVISNWADDRSSGDEHEWDTIISDVAGRAKIEDNERHFRLRYSGYLVAALILLSVIAVSVLMKMEPKNIDLLSKSIAKPSDIKRCDADGIDNTTNRIIKNGKEHNIIDLDSGSRAFVDSGALVSDIRIEDERVSVNVLKGAVSFSVAKKRQRSFIVNAGLADIVVTGTKFRVIRMEHVVTVAVNSGSVYTVYNNGEGKTNLKGGQVAMVMRDTIVVLSNDSIPDLPERKLLKNLLQSYDDIEDGSEPISKRTADSLIDIMFTSGLSFAAEGDMIEHFSCILDSKGRYGDALTVLQHHPEYSSNSTFNEVLTKLRSSLLLKTGDTAAAVTFMENSADDQRNLKGRCDALWMLYKLHLKSHDVLNADTCLHQYVECTHKNEDLDKVIIDHAHLLRNTSLIDAAQFWYEYLLENFAESKYRKDAEYWVSDCVVQKSIGKNSALYNKSTSSGR